MGNGWAAAAELVMRTAAALRWRERGCVRRRWGRPTPLTPRRTKGASAQACDGRVDRGDAVPHRLENIGEGLAVRVVACVARRRGARARTRGPCARWWHGVAGRGGDGVRVCACARYLVRARGARATRTQCADACADAIHGGSCAVAQWTAIESTGTCGSVCASTLAISPGVPAPIVSEITISASGACACSARARSAASSGGTAPSNGQPRAHEMYARTRTWRLRASVTTASARSSDWATLEFTYAHGAPSARGL